MPDARGTSKLTVDTSIVHVAGNESSRQITSSWNRAYSCSPVSKWVADEPMGPCFPRCSLDSQTPLFAGVYSDSRLRNTALVYTDNPHGCSSHGGNYIRKRNPNVVRRWSVEQLRADRASTLRNCIAKLMQTRLRFRVEIGISRRSISLITFNL